jgi:2-oxoglutarate/2-oxoacid ferredoxin oxidoreductase subunit alpha
MGKTYHQNADLSLVFSGEAGQGLQTLEQLMLKVFKHTGYHVFSYSEFMSRIRGGNNSTQIRVASENARSCIRRIDIFVPLHTGAMDRFRDRITRSTVILGDMANVDREYIDGGYPVVEVPVAEMAQDVGGNVYINVILVGVFSGLLGVELDLLEQQVRLMFAKTGDKKMQKNIDAARKGYEKGTHVLKAGQVLPVIRKSEEVKRGYLMNGVDAISIGCLAGGCTFVSSYPMSPSTNVLVFLAECSREFGVVVEQAEDEISAVNMAIGSWYAGGRALVTTSGGGYALMVESMSLAGCIESPLVIHIGQRPGPATGLPTRTEQADLEHSLYSGHGEFPRLILAPGTVEEGLHLARHAFHMADKYQIPVIILTDQYYLDSNSYVEDVTVPETTTESFIARTNEDYRRYRLTGSGISPRGIPGFGEGLVCVDSDEHDEHGHITEDLSIRTAMVDKRLSKLQALKQDSISPTLMGTADSTYLIVGWGSSRHVVEDALNVLQRKDMAFLHFSQVYPLHQGALEIIKRSKRRIIIENNATAQFGKLISFNTGMTFDEKILKYDGMPFMLEEVVERLNSLPREKSR